VRDIDMDITGKRLDWSHLNSMWRQSGYLSLFLYRPFW
jgi:hypothetical protein